MVTKEAGKDGNGNEQIIIETASDLSPQDLLHRLLISILQRIQKCDKTVYKTTKQKRPTLTIFYPELLCTAT